MRRNGHRLTVLLTALVAASGALAFKLSGQRWEDPVATVHVGIPGNAPSGVAWSAALRAAMQRWTDSTVFTFIADDSYVDPCAGSGDGLSGTDFRTTVCGNGFGDGVFAVTLNSTHFGKLGFPVVNQTDIVFNANQQWDVYDGAPQGRMDFRRVALHELGHVIGLDHDPAAAAIMASNYSDVHTLQADDIAGVDALYNPATCTVRDVAVGTTVNDSLAPEDCRVIDLFVGAEDYSRIDVYRLRLAQETNIDIQLQSSAFDPVLLLTDAVFGALEIHDDFEGGCAARIRQRLPAGEYRILVNTYQQPEKCGLNTTGGYSLSLSESTTTTITLPLLGGMSASGGSSANAVVRGGVTVNGGVSFPPTFTADQAVDVLANIALDPLHVGSQGRIYVLATLAPDGRRFMQDSSGNFVRFSGDMSTLVSYRTGALSAQESLTIVRGFKGALLGLTGQTISVDIGYALESSPSNIWYSTVPIRFTITP